MNHPDTYPASRVTTDTTIGSLTEQHLSEWLELLDQLRESHAPTDQLDYCRRQITRLQLDLYPIRNE